VDIESSSPHDHHVTALVSNERFYISGCKDSNIRVFDTKSKERLFLLKGHDKPVTSLSFLKFSEESESSGCYLITGSWDGTAKIWDLNSGQCCATLDGHENTVSVQGLPPQDKKARFATGSAGVAVGNSISDFKIRIYEVASSSSPSSSLAVTLTSTIANDHQGPIRSLSFDDKLQLLLSCSNDGSVKLRDVQTGSCVQTLSFPVEQLQLQKQQQPPMFLDVCTNHHDSIAACGEDGALVIWSTDAASTTADAAANIQTQIIPHPGCIWKVSTLPNHDIVTACHDGVIRIFTRDPTRVAGATILQSFLEKVVESNASKSSGPSNEEIEKLPKWEMNYTLSGKGEGSVQVFNKGGKAIAAQWSAASKTWIEVGEVTGQVGGSNGNSNGGGTINGVSYDFVFPIEIDVPGGGIQKLQIGYNNGENPFVTAQAFIDEHMLDQGYLAQIADYIRTRVGQDGYVPTIGAEGVGGGSSSGGGASVGTGPSPMDYTLTPTPAYQHLPMRGYKSFEAGADMKTLTKVSKKITEFNSALNTNLSSDEVTTVLGNLVSTIASTNRYHATTISDAELSIILKMMKHWTLVNVFPAMDLARLVVLHPDASQMKRSEFWNEIVCTAIEKCDLLLQNLNTVEGPAKVAIPMLSLRLFANSFRGGSGSQLAVESHLARILNCVDKFITSDNKNVRLAAATVLLNVSSHLKSIGKYDASIPDLFLSLVAKVLNCGNYETEAIVRTLVALGTALLVDDVFVQKAKSLFGESIQPLASQHGGKAASVGAEITQILS